MTTRPITIIPIGNIETDIIERVTHSIARTFNITTRVESNLYMSRYIPNPIFGKHNATIILKYLCKELPEDFFKTLVITELDLYSPIFSCLFGEAQLGGRCALISLFRLRQDLVHYAVFHCLLGIEVEVTVGIVGYLLLGLAGMLNQDIPNYPLQSHNLASGYLNIGRLALSTTHRLM